MPAGTLVPAHGSPLCSALSGTINAASITFELSTAQSALTASIASTGTAAKQGPVVGTRGAGRAVARAPPARQREVKRERIAQVQEELRHRIVCFQFNVQHRHWEWELGLFVRKAAPPSPLPCMCSLCQRAAASGST